MLIITAVRKGIEPCNHAYLVPYAGTVFFGGGGVVFLDLGFLHKYSSKMMKNTNFLKHVQHQSQTKIGLPKRNWFVSQLTI